MWQKEWERGLGFDEFLATASANRDLWRDLHARVRVPEEALERVAALGRSYRLLVLGADWCGDAVNTVPVLARLAELSPTLELRHLDRDENPELMDAHLTNGSRSIPVVVVLDEEFRELGWWGPRPSELQQWVMSEGKQLDPTEKYRRIRSWYARDRGASTVSEVVALLERAARKGGGRTEAA